MQDDNFYLYTFPTSHTNNSNQYQSHDVHMEGYNSSHSYPPLPNDSTNMSPLHAAVMASLNDVGDVLNDTDKYSNSNSNKSNSYIPKSSNTSNTRNVPAYDDGAYMDTNVPIVEQRHTSSSKSSGVKSSSRSGGIYKMLLADNEPMNDKAISYGNQQFDINDAGGNVYVYSQANIKPSAKTPSKTNLQRALNTKKTHSKIGGDGIAEEFNPKTHSLEPSGHAAMTPAQKRYYLKHVYILYHM
jgi:hypothetical protein